MSLFDALALILLTAATIDFVNQRYIGLPQPIGMLIGSIVISLAILGIDASGRHGLMPGLRATLDAADLPHVFLDGVLAFLLFAGSLHVPVADLRTRKWVILALATASVILATALFAVGLRAVFWMTGASIPLAWCAVLGAILAPTDAVAVDGLLRRLPLPPALRAAIAGESLFNDGAGVVLFLITLGIAQGQTGLIGHGRVVIALLIAGAGGAAIGAAAGWIAAQAMRRTNDHGLQLTMSLALAMVSYRLADGFEVSGPIAVVTAGLVVGSAMPHAKHGDRQDTIVVEFWSLFDGTLNTILFLLIGFQLLEVPFGRLQVVPIVLSIPLAIVSRLASVAIPLALMGGPRRDRAAGAAILTWAGLRGGISIALVLTLPPVPVRDELLAICYAVVTFTIIVQGATMPAVIRRLYDPVRAGSVP